MAIETAIPQEKELFSAVKRKITETLPYKSPIIKFLD